MRRVQAHKEVVVASIHSVRTRTTSPLVLYPVDLEEQSGVRSGIYSFFRMRFLPGFYPGRYPCTVAFDLIAVLAG